MSIEPVFTQDQEKVLRLLNSTQSVCITGSAGTGKSFVFRHWLGLQHNVPVLASTGAAAVLLGGRTFHSFFGLGVMQGPLDRIVYDAVSRPAIQKNLRSCDTIAIDEISMLGADLLAVAEQIAKIVRNSGKPWGGLRVLVSGDFLQLPPIVGRGQEVSWAFEGDVWRRSNFKIGVLNEIVRTSDPEFSNYLNLIRWGVYDNRVYEFLRSRFHETVPEDFQGTRLYAHRKTVGDINEMMLEKLPGEVIRIETKFFGNESYRKSLTNSMPIPETLCLKIGALVMVRKNALDLSYCNGTLGIVSSINPTEDLISITSIANGKEIWLSKTNFDWCDGHGNVALTAKNFPLCLAWATTIHKAQGATIDRVSVDLRGVWESGQSYVALSRVRSMDQLHIEGWGADSIKVDPKVIQFYRNLEERKFATCG